jgi:hypothetical protein
MRASKARLNGKALSRGLKNIASASLRPLSPTNRGHSYGRKIRALKNRDGLRRPGCHTTFALRRLLLCDALLPELSEA